MSLKNIKNLINQFFFCQMVTIVIIKLVEIMLLKKFIIVMEAILLNFGQWDKVKTLKGKL